MKIKLKNWINNLKIKNKKKKQTRNLYKKECLNQILNIILQNKLERYEKIFNLLDSDHDGFISSKNIKLSSLDNDTLKSFTPILEELQQSDIKINFEQFCKKLDDLIEKTAKQANYFNLDENDE